MAACAYDQIEQAGEELNAVAKYDIGESKLCLGDGAAILRTSPTSADTILKWTTVAVR